MRPARSPAGRTARTTVAPPGEGHGAEHGGPHGEGHGQSMRNGPWSLPRAL